MKGLRTAIHRGLRGPVASRALEACGIDAKKFWLLMDLFGAISERGEIMDQLGRNGVALGTAAIVYAIFSALISLASVASQASPAAHLGVFVVFTGFLFTSILLSEAGNSLINPVEGLVLAHQPITGGTYTAAKLSHLLRIVLWLTPALNGIPAVAGLALPGARWHYPIEHMAAAIGVGLVSSMLCCAAFGWLLRFMPARRLKAVGQFAGAIPFLAVMGMGQFEKAFRKAPWRSLLPASSAGLWTVAAGVGAVAMAVVALGIRSLSADYLIRVSAMMRGGARGGATSRRSAGAAIAGLFAGQGARAGFVFVSRLMRRDWHFRRQMFAIVAPLLIVNGTALVKGWRHDPFAAEFSPIHFAPHGIGMLLVIVGSLAPFGNDYKGGWVFALASKGVVGGFAAGVYAVLAETAIAVCFVIAPFFLFRWGAAHGGLFVAYSLAVSLLYAAVSVRLMDSIPFTRQPDPKRATLTIPILMAAMLVIGLAVALQHFVLFRSMTAVAAATVVIGIAVWMGGRWSAASLAESMRCQLAETAGDGSRIYREVEA